MRNISEIIFTNNVIGGVNMLLNELFFYLLGLIFIIVLFAFFLVFKILKRIEKTQMEHINLSNNILQALKEDSPFREHWQEEAKEEWRSYVLMQALSVRDAVYKQTKGIHTHAIEHAPKEVGLTEKELVDAFSADEVQAITNYWALFSEYVNNYWLTPKGTYKKIFKGVERDPNSEAGAMLAASYQLIKQLDQLLQKIRQE